MPMRYGNELVIARDSDGKEIRLSPDDRARHFYVTGTTGSGKSKFLEGLIRQDIERWPGNEYGLLLLDWHGTIYDGVMKWLASESHIMERPVIPIDLREDKWVVSYNFVRKREAFYNSVLADLLVQQLVYIWGQGDTNQTPSLEATAGTIFQAAIAEGFTLREAFMLLEDKAFRTQLERNATSASVRQKVGHLNSLSAADFYATTRSTYNRLQRLLENDHMNAMLNQPGVSFDFRKALDDNSIVLVSLAQGGLSSKKDSQTFATLMLADLWAAMQTRGKPEDSDEVKPFYTYIDEFQNFVSPTIVESLDQARGFGLHLTLAHQYPSQLSDVNPDLGPRLFNSVMMNTRSKAVFNMPPGTKNDLDPLNEWLFINTWDTQKVKFEQKTRGVVGYDEQTRTVRQQGSSRGSVRGSGSNSSSTYGGASGTHTPGLIDGVSPSAGPSSSSVDNYSDTTGGNEFSADSEGTSEGASEVPVFLPIFGEQVMSTQFFSLEELKQETKKMLAMLHDRDGVVRLASMDEPARIRTADIEPVFVEKEDVEAYRSDRLAQFPFVLPLADALARLADARSAPFLPLTPAQEEEELPVARRRAKGKVKKDADDEEK